MTNNHTTTFVIWIAVLVILPGCNSADNENKEEKIVAEWENITLTQAEFKELYFRETTRKPISDSYAQRKKSASEYLMVKIIAQKAEQAHLDTLDIVKMRLRQAREQALRKTYLQETILKRIPEPNGKQVREAYQKDNTKLKLDQIYAEKKSTIDSIYHLIQQGASFDSLAIKSMQKQKIPSSNTAYHMGWVSWNEMDLAPESVAYSLDIGEISEPVKSMNGYHIFRLKDRKKNINLNNSDFQNARENIAFDWRKRRFMEKLTPFIDSTLSETPLVTNVKVLRNVMPIVSNWFSGVQPNNAYLTLTNKYLEYSFDGQLNPDEPVARMNEQVLTVDEFLSRLPEIPPQIISSGPRATLEFMLKDKLFAQIAEQKGYASHPAVSTKLSVARSKALYYAAMRAALDTVNRTRLQQRYYQNQANDRYAKVIETKISTWHFPDSTSVWEAIKDYQQGNSWADIYSANRNLITTDTTTLTDKRTKLNDSFNRIHSLPIVTDSLLMYGPFSLKSSDFTLVQPIERKSKPFSQNAIQNHINSDIEKNLPQLITVELLPASFNRKNIEFNEEALKEVFNDVLTNY